MVDENNFVLVRLRREHPVDSTQYFEDVVSCISTCTVQYANPIIRVNPENLVDSSLEEDVFTSVTSQAFDSSEQPIIERLREQVKNLSHDLLKERASRERAEKDLWKYITDLEREMNK